MSKHQIAHSGLSQLTQHSTLSIGLLSSDSPEQSATIAHKRYATILLALFFLTLPLVNPWVRGDGVGYYAYVRSLLVEHKLDFSNDWRDGNESFTIGKVHADGTLDRQIYTSTGQIDNHWTVGPSLLWAPVLTPVHLAMLTLRRFGANVKPDGFSRPYIVTMALATALYGFLGLYLSFRFACLFVPERWAFLATLGIWFASSLPVYMYFNPSWSHAHSAFIVAVFFWYWYRTQQERTLTQWVILGLISGLALDMHYVNVAVLLVPLIESLQGYWRAIAASPERDWLTLRRLFIGNLLYSCATVFAFLPTLITRKMIYGNPLDFGYEAVGSVFRWDSPHLMSALFSSDHGLFLWTPILFLAVGGLFLLLKRNRKLASYFIIVFVALSYLIGGDPTWDGLSSFGNRYYICLTPLFILGLAVLFSEFSMWVKGGRQAMIIARSVTAFLVLWNLAFIFQWGMHMIPVRGPISWKQMVRNQFSAVPQRSASELANYFRNRKAMMNNIEQDDIRQWQQQQGLHNPK